MYALKVNCTITEDLFGRSSLLLDYVITKKGEPFNTGQIEYFNLDSEDVATVKGELVIMAKLWRVRSQKAWAGLI